MGYRREVVGARFQPDYRGGASFARRFGANLGPESSGFAYELNTDAVFLSRFDDDILLVAQNRLGFVHGNTQWIWNWNLTTDSKRQHWANFVETGPGLRFRLNGLPKSALFSIDVLRGAYLRNESNPRRPNFYDFRTGFWYAFTY